MTSQNLDAGDRCDRCNAQARLHYEHEFIIGESTGMKIDLLFCAHHSGNYGADLIKLGFKVVADTREELAPKAVGVEVS